jgi:hypothetical protein
MHLLHKVLRSVAIAALCSVTAGAADVAGVSPMLRDGKDPGVPLIIKARDDAFTLSLAKVREWLSSVQLK